MNKNKKEATMTNHSLKIPIYWVDMPADLKPKWFADKSTAIFFAQCLYSTNSIIMNQRPIYEHWLYLEPDAICEFLNKRGDK